jgi:acylphosphatase
MERITIKVKGKVQGVFFRKHTQEVARKLGISGFVRNEADGSVFIDAEALPAELEKFTSWCEHGPARAEVRGLEIKKEDKIIGYTGFEISY